jgi:regulator of replication initiation timing
VTEADLTALAHQTAEKLLSLVLSSERRPHGAAPLAALEFQRIVLDALQTALHQQQAETEALSKDYKRLLDESNKWEIRAGELQTALAHQEPQEFGTKETATREAADQSPTEAAPLTLPSSQTLSGVSPSPAPRIPQLAQQLLSYCAASFAGRSAFPHQPKLCILCEAAESLTALDAALHHATEERESFRAGSLFLEAELAKAHACAKESADAHEQFFQLSNMEIAQLKQQVAKLRIEFEHKVEEIDRLNQILRSNDATIAKLTNERDAAKRLLDSAEKQIEAAQ